MVWITMAWEEITVRSIGKGNKRREIRNKDLIIPVVCTLRG